MSVDLTSYFEKYEALVAQADVVVNTVPLTDRTRGMFDAAFFEAMKPTAYYISVGRGATTVTDDLPPWCRMTGHEYLGEESGEAEAPQAAVFRAKNEETLELMAAAGKRDLSEVGMDMFLRGDEFVKLEDRYFPDSLHGGDVGDPRSY